MEAMVTGNNDELKVFRAIKNNFLLFKTAKDAKILDEKAEISILKKMIKQCSESSDIYKNSNRYDLALEEQTEIQILQKFLPKEATIEEIQQVVEQLIIENNWYTTEGGPEIPKNCMGKAIKLAKEKLTNVDGKILSEYIKLYV